MSNYSDRMAQIMIADHERHMSRQAREDALLSHDEESRAGMADWSCERPLLRGIGMVGTSGMNRRYPHATPRTRAHGAAALPPDAEAAERLAAGDVEATVLCYNASDPDNATVRTVASFRGSRRNRAPVSATPAQVVDTASIGPVHGHNFND